MIILKKANKGKGETVIKYLEEFNWKLFFKTVYYKSLEIDILTTPMILVYATLVSIIELLIFSFFFMSNFNFLGAMDDIILLIEEFVLNNLATGTGHEIVSHIENQVVNFDITQLGIVSFFTLVIVVTFMLDRIERTFNLIWGIKKHRGLLKRFIAFWTFITLGTFIGTLFLNLIISIMESYLGLGLFNFNFGNSFILQISLLLVYVIVFTSIYYWVPNTKVEILSAFIGGITAGSLFYIAKIIYSIYTKNAFTYSQIYGSLSAIPIFLVWLYLIWMIVLFGGVISYVVYHRDHLNYFSDLQESMSLVRDLLPIAILIRISKVSTIGYDQGVSFDEVMENINTPIEKVKENLLKLSKEGFIYVTKDNKYIPANRLKEISVWDICDKLVFNGEVSNNQKNKNKELMEVYQLVRRGIQEKLTDLTIKDLE